MPVALTDYEVGETGYVVKLNANNQALRAYTTITETSQANIASSATSVAAMQSQLFGTKPMLLSETSYRTQAYGSDLVISAGTAWAPSQQAIVQLPSGATVSMSGQPAATYYLNGVNGEPLTQPVISNIARDPLYSFVWNGVTISQLKRLAAVQNPLQRGPETLTYAPTISLDWSLSETLRVTLTGNATINVCWGGYDGQRCMLEVTQDATGGRTLGLGTTAIRVGTDVSWAIDSSPNRRTRIGLVKTGTQYDLAAVARGF